MLYGTRDVFTINLKQDFMSVTPCQARWYPVNTPHGKAGRQLRSTVSSDAENVQ